MFWDFPWDHDDQWIFRCSQTALVASADGGPLHDVQWNPTQAMAAEFRSTIGDFRSR